MPFTIVCLLSTVVKPFVSQKMGQNQSSKGTPSSNYAAKPSPSTSSQRRLSPKGSHKSKSPKDKPRSSKYALPEGMEARTSSVSYTHNRMDIQPQVTRAMTVGHTERSAPSRQFSLMRQTPSTSSASAKHAQIEKYFNKYKDAVEDSILAEGMEKFCVDLGVDPTEFIVLVLAWKFEASQMCRFTREEFLNGCQKMRAYDAKSLRDRFPELLAEAREEKNFKELYNFTFTFGLDHITGQRSLPIDMAIPLWGLVFTQNRPKILDRWFEFLKSSDVRGISRDTWNMFLPFCNTILSDLSNYDESEAWPSLFDDFAEYELSKQL